MNIKKVSSITKLEELERIQLSKSFFMRELLIPLNLPFKRETCHVIHLTRGVPSPLAKERARERIKKNSVNHAIAQDIKIIKNETIFTQ